MPDRRKVLFICEHGSAKSVIAAAHYDRLAREHGIDGHAISRGTDPDAEYPPHVVAGLASEGLEPLDDSPVELSTADIDDATHIVAFCSPNTLPDKAVVLAEVWDDVPPVSGSYDRARDEIVRRVHGLFS